jgi:hypothetical protein
MGRRGTVVAADGEPAIPPPPAVPPARDWDESPAEAARADRAWGDNDYDIHRDEEE